MRFEEWRWLLRPDAETGRAALAVLPTRTAPEECVGDDRIIPQWVLIWARA